jgi:hypothetical protein
VEPRVVVDVDSPRLPVRRYVRLQHPRLRHCYVHACLRQEIATSTDSATQVNYPLTFRLVE